MEVVHLASFNTKSRFLSLTIYEYRSKEIRFKFLYTQFL